MKLNKLFLLPALTLALACPGAAYAAETLSPAKDVIVTNDKPQTERATPQISNEKRGQIKEMMAKIRQENSAVLEKMKGLREEIKSIISATKFDKEAFLSKSAEMSALQAQIKQKTTASIASLLEKMSPDERKIFASRPQRRGPPRMSPKGMKGQGDISPLNEKLPPPERK